MSPRAGWAYTCGERPGVKYFAPFSSLVFAARENTVFDTLSCPQTKNLPDAKI